ncbi:MAG: ATPase [Proteobacteria bacterium]|nr:ATPase [Pseudomonadota bacterium]
MKPHNHDKNGCGSCHSAHDVKKIDVLLWGSLTVILAAYALFYFDTGIAYLTGFSHHTHEMVNDVWWGILFGLFVVGLLGVVPKEAVTKILGSGKGVRGILRATLAGFLFDLCNHGILLIASKLYERGASLGQVMAFLISSPWNSFSLLFVLWSLVGIKWTLLIVVLSMVIAVISGLIFDKLVEKNILLPNPNALGKVGKTTWKQAFSGIEFNKGSLKVMLHASFIDSRMVLRWLFVGMILTALLQTFMPEDMFKHSFGPTAIGLAITLLFATVVEVCSEGSVPLAADIFTRAGAPGNAFAFLMAGVSTDYTEILVIKQMTGSWKTAFFLPLVTLPQIILIALILNHIIL